MSELSVTLHCAVPCLLFSSSLQVPFRLTRDLVDGMGVCGVGGVFTRSCEATLAVMRANKEALLTIIEVFIHDPLYKWALSPLKALQLQGQVSSPALSFSFFLFFLFLFFLFFCGPH